MPSDRVFVPAPSPRPAHRVRRTLLRLAARALRGAAHPDAQPALPTDPRILVIRPDHLGDALLATPALTALRAALPTAELTWLVGPWSEAVARRHPAVDHVLALPFPGFTRAPQPTPWSAYTLVAREAARLRPYRFDAVLVLRFDHWWGALLAALARIPRRIGYATPDVAAFLTTALPHDPGAHVVRSNLNLVAALTGQPIPATLGAPPLVFPPTPAEDAAAVGWLHDRGLPDAAPFVVIHPGAGAIVKLWEADAWAAVADALAGEGLRVVLTGGPAEADLTRDIASRLRRPALDAAGAFDLGGLAAVLGRARLVLGVDSGPLHLATAQGVPTVRLYGPVDPHVWGPWADSSIHRALLSVPPLACQFCERLDYSLAELPLHPCVRWITVDQVLRAARDLLSASPSGM